MRETIQLYWTSIVQLIAEWLHLDRLKGCCTFKLKIVLTTLVICFILFGAASFAVLYKWENCSGGTGGSQNHMFDPNDPDLRKIMGNDSEHTTRKTTKLKKSDAPKTTTSKTMTRTTIPATLSTKITTTEHYEPSTTTTIDESRLDQLPDRPKVGPKLLKKFTPSTTSITRSTKVNPNRLREVVGTFGVETPVPPPDAMLPTEKVPSLLDSHPNVETTPLSIWKIIEQHGTVTPCPPGTHPVRQPTPSSRLARRQAKESRIAPPSILCKCEYLPIPTPHKPLQKVC